MLALLESHPAQAAWPGPATNLPLCTAAGDQSRVAGTSDGAGGILSVWRDTRGGTGTGIFVQRALGSGVVAAGWPANGLQVCLTTGDRLDPAIVPDGGGGAILVWTDGRSVASGTKIYAQHALTGGPGDPAWPVDGRLLASVTGDQFYPGAVADGAGGALITWQGEHFLTNIRILAHHLKVNVPRARKAVPRRTRGG